MSLTYARPAAKSSRRTFGAGVFAPPALPSAQQAVYDAAVALSYSPGSAAAAGCWWDARATVKGCPSIQPRHWQALDDAAAASKVPFVPSAPVATVAFAPARQPITSPAPRPVPKPVPRPTPRPAVSREPSEVVATFDVSDADKTWWSANAPANRHGFSITRFTREELAQRRNAAAYARAEWVADRGDETIAHLNAEADRRAWVARAEELGEQGLEFGGTFTDADAILTGGGI